MIRTVLGNVSGLVESVFNDVDDTDIRYTLSSIERFFDYVR